MLDIYKLFTISLDIVLVWVSILLIFKVLSFSVQKLYILLGIFIISLIKLIMSIVDLPTMKIVFDYLFTQGPLIIIILFHDEIKGNLEKLGRYGKNIRKSNFFNSSQNNDDSDLFWHQLDYSLRELSSLKMGALITIENETALKNHIKEGTKLDALFSSELVKTIFDPKFSSLHDGAMIIKDQKIYSVNNYYPLQTDVVAKFEHGTRHRAALSISQVSDSITFIVSEESAKISVAYRGKIIGLENNFHSFDVVSDLLHFSKGDNYVR